MCSAVDGLKLSFKWRPRLPLAMKALFCARYAVFLCTSGCFLSAFFGFLTISKTDDVITANSFSSLTAKSKCSPRERSPASGEFSSDRLLYWATAQMPSRHRLLGITWNHPTLPRKLREKCRKSAVSSAAAPTTNAPVIFCGLVKSMNNWLYWLSLMGFAPQGRAGSITVHLITQSF